MPGDVKQQITDTLLGLLEKITVKELVTLCGISRQTFYYHFEDVLDVVDWWTRQGAQMLMGKSVHTDAEKETLVNQLYWLLFQNPWGHILHS